MNIKTMQVNQLRNKIETFANLGKIASPPIGWIKAIRLALGMSSRQLGNKLSMTRQGVRDIEEREKDGSVTLKSLKAVANALDMELVYGFVPKDKNLQALIDRKAKELAIKIVSRTSNSMRLEDQESSKERIEKAIEERAESIKREMPKSLWD